MALAIIDDISREHGGYEGEVMDALTVVTVANVTGGQSITTHIIIRYFLGKLLLLVNFIVVDKQTIENTPHSYLAHIGTTISQIDFAPEKIS